MAFHNEGLEKEMGYISKPFEVKHIKELFEGTDPIMHDLAYNLINGNHNEIDRLSCDNLATGP